MKYDNVLAAAPIGFMGVTPPKTVDELIWYAFGLLGAYFLWSIKAELTRIRIDLKDERGAREALALQLASFRSRCDERHKHDDLRSPR